MTNADKYFRNATDEELSVMLYKIATHWFPFAIIWEIKEWFDWLKQEVTDNG
jgi:hypothetical protein